MMSRFETEAAVAHVAGYFDELARAEWDRHDATPAARMALELHRRLLHRHVRPGTRVLEIGAGPGRFTAELAAAGARVTVADLSPVQLALNEATMREAGLADAVDAWVRCDIRDVSRWGRGVFDAVVAFGGPISYTFEDAERVTAGLLGLLKPGGMLLASLMSTLGSWRIFLPTVVAQIEAGVATMETLERVVRTGDTRHLPEQPHICRTFRADEVAAMVESGGGTVVELMASAWCANNSVEQLGVLATDPVLWQRFVGLEEDACARPGALDGGTHILVAAEVADHLPT
jgi:2-polyprenyl-3-methyl-5-hydroxy-6-metoxy-1,4-benzoquinol methylase